MTKKRKEFVEVEFWDHAGALNGSRGLIKSSVVGYLVDVDDKAIYICTWFNESEGEREVYSIFKKAITKLKKLK